VKGQLQALVRQSPSPAAAHNLVREYLQARILASLQRVGAMIPLAFHGGTALRFLHAIGRYSEDLDFALEGDPGRYDLVAYLEAIRADLRAEGYEPTLKVSDRKTVQGAFVRFPGLLFELGISPRKTQVLSIKVEVDTRPPAGAGRTTSVVRRHVTLQLQHHDRASLLSGKLHAVLQRPYLKGRDLFDLLWYRSDPGWPAPNLIMLNNALAQSGWAGGPLDGRSWLAAVRARIEQIDVEQAVADVRPFLEPGAGPELLTRDNLLRVLGGVGRRRGS